MKLINHKFKLPATVIFYGSLLLGLYSLSGESNFDEIWKVPVYSFFGHEEGLMGFGKKGWIETGILNELITILIICSGLMASFSREKVEDELISKIRLESLSVAIVLNYALLILTNLLVFDFAFLTVLIVFLFAPLLMFHIIFRIRLYKYYRSEK